MPFPGKIVVCESRTLPDIDMRVDPLSAYPPVSNNRWAASRAAVGPSSAAMEGTMKIVIILFIAASLASGCVSGSLVSHEDSPAATKRDQGPALCRDGTVPPCNDRG
jgi:hypothetical protein